MTLSIWTIPTALSPLSIAARDEVVVASGFTDSSTLTSRLGDTAEIELVSDLGATSRSVESYLAGDVNALDAVKVAQPGQAFHQQVWEAMRQIPAGQTWTYAELATKAGRPAAVRSAASACARNLVAPFVPCHRVVRSDGSMGGYYYGTAIKKWLLQHEAQQK